MFAAPEPAPEEPTEVVLVETVEAVAAEPAPDETRARRRSAVVAVAAVAALALGGTAWTVLRGDGDDDGFWSDRLGQPAAVATEPDLAWTWDAGDQVRQVVTAGPTTYVVTRSGVTALDADGDAEWTTDLPGGSFLQVPPGLPDLVLAIAYEAGVVMALDPDDGSERWTAAAGDYYDAVGDRVIVLDDGTVRALDARTGDEQWSATGTVPSIGIGPDAVYLADDDRLRRLDVDSGKHEWSRDLGWTSGQFKGMTVADGFVVAAGRDTARAFDSDSGTTRWTVDLEFQSKDYGPSSGLVNRSAVYLWDTEADEVAVYDGNGRIGSLPADDARGGYFFPVHGADGDHVIGSGGAVYDADLDEVARTDPNTVAASGDGLYAVAGRAVSYTPFGASEPAWELDIGMTPSDQVTAGDGHLVISNGSQVSDYR
ncbi:MULTISPECIES: PQQ-binding-like beta-propeller repeat protein [unclassified Nocardioides]|uniref:outer membrane protein assembly factor BamB family protein n=1 Tax=unclassified Nocardioides TaxID=2615069 RepID=UPI00361604C3